MHTQTEDYHVDMDAVRSASYHSARHSSARLSIHPLPMGSRGGGVALVHRDFIKVRVLDTVYQVSSSC
jgi:hypothetical protein